MKLLAAVPALTIAALLAACASTGVRVDESRVAQFHDGTTSYSEVVSALGKPTTTSLASTGVRTISYIYAHAQMRAASLIPVVGIFAGGMDTNSTVAAFVFDANGVLTSHSSSSSNLAAGTGVISGGTQPSH